MATYNAAYMAIPPDTGESPSLGANHIRSFKSEVSQRMDQEHVWLDTSSTGQSVPRSGHGRAYYQATAPTLRPDGITSLGANDTGRLWIDSDDGAIDYWNGAAFASIPYLELAGGTVTGAVTFSAGVTCSSTVHIDGAVEFDSTTQFDGAATFNSTITLTSLIVDQGSADTNIIVLKSSDVSTVTGDADGGAGTYGRAIKYSATVGGLKWTGYSESNSTPGISIYGSGYAATTTSTAALGYTAIVGQHADGSLSGTADDNIMVIRSYDDAGLLTRHIFKRDGDIYYDGSNVTSYDSEDDFALIQAANKKDEQSLFRRQLEDLGIIQNGFISHRRMTWLQIGTLARVIRGLKKVCSKIGMDFEELANA